MNCGFGCNNNLVWKSSHEIDVASMPKLPMPALRTPFRLPIVFIWLSIFPKLSSECWKATVPKLHLSAIPANSPVEPPSTPASSPTQQQIKSSHVGSADWIDTRKLLN